MQNLKSCQSIGLILLSSDFCVTGMNDYAKRVLTPALGEKLGKNLLDYHPRKARDKIKGLLKALQGVQPDAPFAMVIDVLNKVLMINLCRLLTSAALKEPVYAMTFIDVTEQTGAEVNPASGILELKKFPVCCGGSFLFLDASSISFIKADGNYCKVFARGCSYYVQMTLKNIMSRYARQNFFRVHRSYIVNLELVKELKKDNGGTIITVGQGSRTSVPVARRRAALLKRTLTLK